MARIITDMNWNFMNSFLSSSVSIRAIRGKKSGSNGLRQEKVHALAVDDSTPLGCTDIAKCNGHAPVQGDMSSHSEGLAILVTIRSNILPLDHLRATNPHVLPFFTMPGVKLLNVFTAIV
jgi:hypothetical protein